MKVKRILLTHFRNYPKLILECNDDISIFIGQNAQGKTNILEAIYLAAVGRSHRTNQEDDLIEWDQEKAVVDILFSRLGVDHSLHYSLPREARKEIWLNQYPIKPKDVIGTLNCVLFSPEDLWLIKGVPALRRRFLDTEISQAVPAYYRHLLQFNRILNQRNHLLKKIREKKASQELLSSWDEQFSKEASTIVTKRMEALKKLTMLANLMHRKLTGSKENLTITYWQAGGEENIIQNITDWFLKNLLSLREGDISRGSTSIGPHRDDLIFAVNGKDLRNFGSQGQQRTGILALKLAELEFLKSETSEYPILLLDDVMSELDCLRRDQLLAFIRNKIQTFITATDVSLFPNLKTGQYYTVKEGTVLE